MKQNIGDKMLKIIMSMYDKARARVHVCHSSIMGDSFDSKCGILQGSILSLLFNEYLTDLPNFLDHCNGIMINTLNLTHIAYADDIVLLASSAEQLQQSVNSLHEFCSKWHLIVNIDKTKVMKIGDKSQCSIYYNGKQIEEITSFKYLGHSISNNSNIHIKMTNYLVTQAQKAIFALQGDTKISLGYKTPQLSLKMFDTYILPILEYNSELWTKTKQVNEIERVQLGYLKHMLGVRKQTPTLAVYGETGRFPLHIRQQLRMINYWLKLEKLPNDTILKKCLIFQKSVYTNTSWFGKVRQILSNHNMNLDSLDNIENIKGSLLRTFKGKLYEQYQDRFFSEINDQNSQPKLRTYRLIKKDLRTEPYLLLNISRKVYTKIARFRTSSHNLRIETGRHEIPKLPVENRICNKCSLNEVEDEIHCLLVCPNQGVVREMLFDVASNTVPNFQQLSNHDKFVAIMTTREPELLKLIGKFLLSADV